MSRSSLKKCRALYRQRTVPFSFWLIVILSCVFCASDYITRPIQLAKLDVVRQAITLTLVVKPAINKFVVRAHFYFCY